MAENTSQSTSQSTSQDTCGCSTSSEASSPQVLASATTCNDGAISGSDGPGTCSWHGGVSKN
jgi:hypothetical protein